MGDLRQAGEMRMNACALSTFDLQQSRKVFFLDKVSLFPTVTSPLATNKVSICLSAVIVQDLSPQVSVAQRWMISLLI